MKALILAAGLGRRLQHKTSDRPKAMTIIGKKAIIEYQIDALLNAGVREIGIVLGYKKDVLTAFLAEKFPDLRFLYFENERYNDSDSAYSFWKARSFVEGDCYLHLNCDILFPPALIRDIMTSAHSNVIAVRKDIPLTDKMENVHIDENGRITRMSITHFPDANAKAFGLAKLSTESTRLIISLLAPYIERGDYHQNYYGMIRQAVAHLPYWGKVSDKNHLLEVNTLTDLEFAKETLASTFKLEKISG
jgi:choline kinase